MSGIYHFTATSLAGEDVPLKRYEGQVLLIVNTASACGFTPQYKGLEALQRELAPRGFSVLGFPCNQFGAQEPGNAKEIAAFCASNYDISFPMFDKIDVNGANAHPLYQYLKGEKSGLLGSAIAILAARQLISGSLGLTTGRTIMIGVVCVLVAIAGAATARLGASGSALKASVAEGRWATVRPHRPLWQRLYVDLVCLGLSGLIYWLTARTGFSAVVNPDSNPTLSLSVYMFFAPALLWLGATLLLVRLRGRVLAWVVARGVAGGRAEDLRGFLLASASRRAHAINRGLVLVGLLLAFGVNLGIFTATYDRQTRVDAQLSLGADVVVNAPPGTVAKNRLAAMVKTHFAGYFYPTFASTAKKPVVWKRVRQDRSCVPRLARCSCRTMSAMAVAIAWCRAPSG